MANVQPKFEFVEGGVTAPLGFTAGTACCGIKPGNKTKLDLCIIKSDGPANAAGIFTKNAVKAAAVTKTISNLKNGTAQCIVANSGNANCCNKFEHEAADTTAELCANAVGVNPDDVLVASTGVIGEVLNMDAVKKGIAQASNAMSKENSSDCAAAIMTTDTVKKEFAVQLELDGKQVKIGAIAKGSGMIHINMGTMLSFVTTDAAVAPEILKTALLQAAEETYNMVTVDGDTSTNDTLVILANGLAQNKIITEKNDDYKNFVAALTALFEKIARTLAKDGEGATKLIVTTVNNAKTAQQAKKIAKTVAGSSLVKSAMFGADANWGRILCAVGYSGAAEDVSDVDVCFKSASGSIAVCKKSKGLGFDEEKATQILQQSEIEIIIDMHSGDQTAHAYGCDLTYDYVKINGSYRT
ncbi:MAG: bifunctional ornithine acetyltransferase/N-acetylglutamate synthase [Oscillospiraceae bacterium]|jgi:glutamate N-acetyltransferase/amino-acid N-acetyltransferase|nr:bifunctional ornithine acetyltransferase/N-acetylglutamate synthase [Oscillospiraceae bacterium]